jgi:hypothetical protein
LHHPEKPGLYYAEIKPGLFGGEPMAEPKHRIFNFGTAEPKVVVVQTPASSEQREQKKLAPKPAEPAVPERAEGSALAALAEKFNKGRVR